MAAHCNRRIGAPDWKSIFVKGRQRYLLGHVILMPLSLGRQIQARFQIYAIIVISGYHLDLASWRAAAPSLALGSLNCTQVTGTWLLTHQISFDAALPEMVIYFGNAKHHSI